MNKFANNWISTKKKSAFNVRFYYQKYPESGNFSSVGQVRANKQFFKVGLDQSEQVARYCVHTTARIPGIMQRHTTYT